MAGRRRCGSGGGRLFDPDSAGHAIRLRLFGRPDVAFADNVSVLRAERHHRLLAYLAFGGKWIERSDLAALLWPAHRRELAHANLRKALHLARALPWGGAVETQGSGVRFLVGCDVHEFEASAREGRLADALRLRRGELLDGFDDVEPSRWQRRARSRTRRGLFSPDLPTSRCCRCWRTGAARCIR